MPALDVATRGTPVILRLQEEGLIGGRVAGRLAGDLVQVIVSGAGVNKREEWAVVKIAPRALARADGNNFVRVPPMHALLVPYSQLAVCSDEDFVLAGSAVEEACAAVPKQPSTPPPPERYREQREEAKRAERLERKKRRAHESMSIGAPPSGSGDRDVRKKRSAHATIPIGAAPERYREQREGAERGEPFSLVAKRDCFDPRRSSEGSGCGCGGSDTGRSSQTSRHDGSGGCGGGRDRAAEELVPCGRRWRSSHATIPIGARASGCNAAGSSSGGTRPALAPKPELWAATENNDCAAVRRLLEEGADPEERYQGWTPLMKASEAGRVEIMQLLLDRGANIEATNRKGRGALSFAAAPSMHRPNVLEGLRLLLHRGADKDHADNDGYTAKARATNEKRDEAVAIFELFERRATGDLG